MIFTYFSQLIVFLSQATGSFGLGVVVFTILLRLILLPISLSSLRVSKKMTDVAPKLSELKKKHAKDPKALQQAQLNLYKEHNINPASGCLPQIVQLVVLIFLWQAFLNLFKLNQGGLIQVNGTTLNPVFYWSDLTKPDGLYVWPILAGASQLLLSLMMMPKKVTSKTPVPVKNNNKKPDQPDFADTMMGMQKQMLIIMPVMTTFIGISLPAGLSMYWFITTIVSILQQWYVSGWGVLSDSKSLVLASVKRFKS